MYIKINDSDNEYPYELSKIYSDYPDTSFPANLTNLVLGGFNIFEVSETAIPASTATQVAYEIDPIENLGVYSRAWAMRDKTEDELIRDVADRLYALKKSRVTDVSKLAVTTSSGSIFDGDEDSQNRMARSIVAMDETDTITWVLADNSIKEVTKAELREALRLAGSAMSNIWVGIYE